MSKRFLISGFCGLVCSFAALAAGTCPAVPVRSVTGSSPPADVCVPAGMTGLTIDYFDDDSWKAFIAMLWPSVYGARGMADDQRTVTGSGPRVFETFKPLWEVFHQDGSAPASPDFQRYEVPRQNACRVRSGYGDMVLASASGFHDLGQTSDGGLTGPLVAQNRTYVRYLTSYNEIAFHHIESRKWYLRSALPVVPVPRPRAPAVEFPVGSIVVKTAWLATTGLTETQKSRMYVRMATVKDGPGGQCRQIPMGLIGMHIARKTASRPQWIWSSFEQVDLVPPAEAGGPGRYLLNDGTGTPMPDVNPVQLIPLARVPPPPVNIERSAKVPIHAQTMETNQAYRKLLAGSVWQNYQLVLTQWPQAPGDQSLPVPVTQAGDIFQTFPGDGATSAYSNMTMETFQQARPAQGCMNCHNRARLTSDFMWTVQMHAYPEQILLPPMAPSRPKKK